MISFIDNFLNKITMYRLTFYFLAILVIIASILGFLGKLPYGGFTILLSWIVVTATCFIVNRIFSWAYETPINDDSVYITAFILTLIVSPATTLSGFILLVWVSVLSISTKYFLTWKRKHFFNPAALGVFLTATFLIQSANWWVGNAFLLPFVVVGGLLVTRKIRRFSLVLSFLIVSFLTTILFNIPRDVGVWETIVKASLHAPAFFFAFVMLTEPATTPSTRTKRILYGSFVGFLFAPQIHFWSYALSPETALLIGNLFSYALSPTKKMALSLKEKIKVAHNTYDFVFELDKPMKFKAGQYMEWTVGHDKPDLRGVRRYFTIASAPEENELRIGIRFADEGSSYKKALLDMKKGGRVVAAALAGDFTLPKDPSKKLVFVAGGIGITPFRSILKHLLHTKEKRDIVVLYSNKHLEDIAYTDILTDAHKEFGIKTLYTLSDVSAVPTGWPGETGYISEKMVKKAIPDFLERTFYISGPESLVNAMKKTLREIGVKRTQIRTDYFPGF